MKEFKAEIEIIGINPFVFIPNEVLNYILEKAEKSKGKVPVQVKINGLEFEQTLVKYSGHWRLYLNTPMRKHAKREVGEMIVIQIDFDPKERKVPFHPEFRKALEENECAKKKFNDLAPSLKKEILKYLSFLKTEESVDRNVKKAINFLLGKERFIGRDKP